jgi:hypothetical protein
MLAFLCTIVPAALILFTTSRSGVFNLPLPDAPPPSKSARLRRFLLLNWPWIITPFLLAYSCYSLLQADLPATSWMNLGLLVLVPVCFTLLLTRSWNDGRRTD